jgi:hypothetical protein
LNDDAEPYLNADNIYLMPIEKHPFWSRIETDPAFKEEIIDFMKTTIDNELKTNQKNANAFKDLQLNE